MYLVLVASLFLTSTILSLSASNVDNKNCTYESWSVWSACSLSCNGGVRTRFRYVNQSSFAADNVTSDCPGAVAERGSCNEHPCPIDCMVSNWEHWNQCNCRILQRTRQRKVSQAAAFNGTKCPNLIQTKSCRSVCNRDCIVSDWSSWSACSATCGKGDSSRFRKKIVLPLNHGVSCPETWQFRVCPLHPCPKRTDGIIADPRENCSSTYLSCVSEKEEWRLCPEKLVFDQITNKCQYSEDLDQCLALKSSANVMDVPLKSASLLTTAVMVLIMIVLVVRVMTWDTGCCD